MRVVRVVITRNYVVPIRCDSYDIFVVSSCSGFGQKTVKAVTLARSKISSIDIDRMSLFYCRVDTCNTGASASHEQDSAGQCEYFEFTTGSSTKKAQRTKGRLRLFRVSGDRTRSDEDERDDEKATKTKTKIVCVPFVPRTFSTSDICRYFQSCLETVLEFRIVCAEEAGIERTHDAVIIAFRNEDSAEEFVQNFNLQKFSELNGEDICKCLFVKRVSYGEEEGSSSLGDDVVSADMVELPSSCPVCLDRLDSDVSGILTTSCGHSFHSGCVQNGVSGACPVCRFSSDAMDEKINGRRANETKCESCECTNSLWSCLICGAVGCGRYENRHAVAHWTESGHCYSLEIGTGRVWDYSRDQFVHRLIQGKHGLVELTPNEKNNNNGSNNQSSSSFSSSSSRLAQNNNRVVEGPGGGEGGYQEDPELSEALVASKLDNVANEYDRLLISQLEGQRQHYEKLLLDVSADKDEALKRVSVVSEQATKLRVATKRASEAEKRLIRLEEENTFLSQLNEQLLADANAARDDKTKLTTKSKENEKIKALEDKIVELEQMNRDLMFFLESKDAIQNSKGTEMDARFGQIELGEKEVEETTTLHRGSMSTRDRLRQKVKDRQKK